MYVYVYVCGWMDVRVRVTCGRRGHTLRGGDRTPVYSKRMYERMGVSCKYGVCVCVCM